MKLLIKVILSALLFTSCVVMEEDKPALNPADNFTLSFQMVTSANLTGNSRTDNLHNEVGSEFEDLEEGIDVKDLGIFVFAGEKLVFKTTDISNSTNLTVDGSPGSYIVNMTILRDELKTVLGYDIDPNATAKVPFRILILANCTDENHSWSGITAETYESIIDQVKGWTYTMDNLYNSAYAVEDAIVSELYTNSKKHIPMFGTNVFEVTQKALYYSRPDNRLYLGEMDLLRALAKVRVIDNITKNDGYPKIIGVSFVGTQDAAHQLPADVLNYNNGNQVHTPNMVNPDAQLSWSNVNNPVYRLGVMPSAWTDVPADNRKGEVRVGFVPEQRIGNADGDISKGLPMFNITVARYKMDNGQDFIQEFKVPMTKYVTPGESPENVPAFNFGENILRNHIYTLKVDAITNASLVMQVDVVPYRSCTLESDFGLDPSYYDPAITEEWKTKQVDVFAGDWSNDASTDWSTPNNVRPGSNTRFAAVSGGKLYTIDQKTMSIAEITPEGNLEPTYYLPKPANPADYYGTAIAADEAGNFLIGMNFVQRPSSSTKFAIYSPSESPENRCREFNLDVPERWTVGRLDCIGHVLGDLTRDGIFTIVPEKGYTSEVRIIEVKGDGNLASVTLSEAGSFAVGGNYTQQNIAVPAYHSMAEVKDPDAVMDFYYSSCDGTHNYYATYNGNNDEVTNTFTEGRLYTTVAGTNGFDTFVLNKKRFFVRNWATEPGARTMNIVVMDNTGKSLARWINSDYQPDGGYSTIIVEPIVGDDKNVFIYVFNSGNNKGAAAKLKLNYDQLHLD